MQDSWARKSENARFGDSMVGSLRCVLKGHCQVILPAAWPQTLCTCDQLLTGSRCLPGPCSSGPQCSLDVLGFSGSGDSQAHRTVVEATSKLAGASGSGSWLLRCGVKLHHRCSKHRAGLGPRQPRSRLGMGLEWGAQVLGFRWVSICSR